MLNENLIIFSSAIFIGQQRLFMNNSNFVSDRLADKCRGSSGVEQLIRNQQVVSSNLILGSS